jgi:hypothetical protein
MTDQLSIAMQMPDDGVQKGSRKQPSSLTSQIAALDLGEVCCKMVAVDASDLKSLSTIKKGLSDGAYSSVKGAKNRNGMSGAEFSIETSHTITASGNVYAVAIIKRMK